MARHVTRVTEVRECARRRIFGRAAGNPLLLVVFPLRCSTENSSGSRRARRDGGTVRSREQHADHGSQRPQRRHRQRIVCCPTTLWVNTALRAAHLPPTSKATFGFDPHSTLGRGNAWEILCNDRSDRDPSRAPSTGLRPAGTVSTSLTAPLQRRSSSCCAMTNRTHERLTNPDQPKYTLPNILVRHIAAVVIPSPFAVCCFPGGVCFVFLVRSTAVPQLRPAMFRQPQHNSE